MEITWEILIGAVMRQFKIWNAPTVPRHNHSNVDQKRHPHPTKFPCVRRAGIDRCQERSDSPKKKFRIGFCDSVDRAPGHFSRIQPVPMPSSRIHRAGTTGYSVSDQGAHIFFFVLFEPVGAAKQHPLRFQSSEQDSLAAKDMS